MIGAKKRDALLALAAEADATDLGLISAALTQIAGLNLASAVECVWWAEVCERDSKLRGGDGRNILERAAKVLRAVAS